MAMRKSTVNNLHTKHILFLSKQMLVRFPYADISRNPKNYGFIPLIIPIGFLINFKVRIATLDFSYMFATCTCPQTSL